MSELTEGSPSPEAIWLRKHWSDLADSYKEQWIAVKGESVIKSSATLDQLIADTIAQNPLYAFVYVGGFQ